MSSTSKKSAGLLLYRETAAEMEVLLVHPGGLSGRRKTKDPGRYLRGSSQKTESRWQQPSASSKRRWALRLWAILLRWSR